METADALQLNPLTLAFVGDGVFTLFVRTYAVEHFDLRANKMDAFCRAFVKAEAQAEVYRTIECTLSETELGISKRARNSHPGNKAKNASLADYMHATAFEAVIGYLYVTGDTVRLNEIENAAIEIITANHERVLRDKQGNVLTDISKGRL